MATLKSGVYYRFNQNTTFICVSLTDKGVKVAYYFGSEAYPDLASQEYHWVLSGAAEAELGKSMAYHHLATLLYMGVER